jgi:tetratricopeptide (TPR) repeat protein
MTDSAPTGIDARIENALEAIDRDEMGSAKKLIADASEELTADDARLLHLQAMLSWAQGDIEEAARMITEAVDAGPSGFRIYVDCAELMLSTGIDLDVAEASLRAVLDRGDLGEGEADQAKILLAQVCLEQVDVDAEEALELLASASESVKSDPYWISTKAAALLEMGRGEDAIALWERAVADPEAASDPDVHYQLGICYAATGRGEQAVAAMTRVLELDAEADEYEPLESDETDGLRSLLEEVLEGIPEPLLKKIASAPIEVQTRPRAEQIATGIDPRAFLAFDGEAAEQKLRAVVVMRNVLLDELEDEEQLPEALISGLIDEFRRFFGVEELAVASV